MLVSWNDFDWSSPPPNEGPNPFVTGGSIDYSWHKSLECKNHPECKYSTKGPGRSLFYISSPLTKECTCSVTDLMVVVGQNFTVSADQERGMYYLSNSGPQYKYAVRGGAYTIAVFEPEAEDFAKDYVEELAPKYNDGWIKIVLV